MEEDTYLEQEDIKDQLEHQGDLQWDSEWEANVPQLRKSESLFSLFQKVWKNQDSSKVANLNNVELGKLDISVRDAQHIGLLADTFHHETFGKFFRKNAEITLATSASKKGWFTELFVSQKKFTTRSTGNGQGFTPEQAKRWNIFGSRSSSPAQE